MSRLAKDIVSWWRDLQLLSLWAFPTRLPTSYCQRGTTHLGNCDAALLGQLLFSLLAGIRVAEVWVEILVQNFRRLLAEVSPFPPEWGAKREKGQVSLLMGTSINSSIWIAQIAQSISHINGENNVGSKGPREWDIVSCSESLVNTRKTRLQPINWQAHTHKQTVTKHIQCLIWSVGLQSPVQACNVASLVWRMGGLCDGAQSPVGVHLGTL